MHSPQHNLQDPLRIQPHNPTIRSPPGHRVNDIPLAPQILQSVVEIIKSLGSLRVVPDLKELNPQLPGGGFELIKLLGDVEDDGFGIIVRLAVRQDDDVQRLDILDPIRSHSLSAADIRFQDGVEAGARRGAAAGLDAVEDLFDFAGRGDVEVVRGIRGVEEVDVDAVAVVLGADWGDGHEGVAGFAPFGAGHGAGVVDEEDGVEGGEEGVGVVGCGSDVCWSGRV